MVSLCIISLFLAMRGGISDRWVSNLPGEAHSIRAVAQQIRHITEIRQNI